MTLAWVPGSTPAEAATCGDWTSSSGQAELGTSAATDGEWTQHAHDFGFPEMLGNRLMRCSALAHLICIEQ